MDESAAASTREDGDENGSCSDDRAPENSADPPAEETAYIEECSVACKDCGLIFTNADAFKTHLHQHALEEEDAQMGDGRTPAAGIISGSTDVGGNRNEGVADEGSISSTPSDLLQDAAAAPTSSIMSLGQKVYACLVCGKVYSYLVSFKKHQKLHETPPPPVKAQNPSEQNLRKYECPDCGMLFIRRTRLIGHLKVHRSRRRYISTPPKCDLCNKYFPSTKRWLDHLELHNQKRFWCLTCSRGYKDEVSLDKHLQSHSLKQHKPSTDEKNLQAAKQPMNRPYKPTRANSHQCTLCGKSFCHFRNLIAHRKKHFRGKPGMYCKPLGITEIIEEEGNVQTDFLATRGNQDPEVDSNMKGLPGQEESVPEKEDPSHPEDADFVDRNENSEESDCGEPVHCFKLAKLLSWPDPSRDQKSEMLLEVDGSKREHREHKYWEWECIECDMGFDEMTMLHLHYVKHATGEVPMPQHDTE